MLARVKRAEMSDEKVTVHPYLVAAGLLTFLLAILGVFYSVLKICVSYDSTPVERPPALEWAKHTLCLH